MGAVRKGLVFLIASVLALGLLILRPGESQAAMVFHSGFESGDSLEWSSTWGSFSIQTSIKRTGTYAMRCAPATSPEYVDAGATANRGTFYLYITTAPSIETIIAGRNSTSSIRITATPMYIKLYDGSLDVGTSTTQLATGTWYRISFGRGSANVAVYIDGTQEILTTTPLANNFAESVGVISTGAVLADLCFDDVAFDDTASTADVGDIHVLPSVPNAAGDLTQLTPSTAPNWDCVNEIPSAGDTDYCTSTAASQTDLYNIQDASVIGLASGDTINAVRTLLGAAYIGSGGPGAYYLAVKDYGTEYDSQIYLSKAPGGWFFRYDATMPGGGGAWTQTRFNAFQIGAKRGTGGSRNIRDYAEWTMVAYTRPPTVNSVTLPETSMTPQTQYSVTVVVSHANKLSELSTVVLKVWYDSDGGIPPEGEYNAATANTQTCAIITYTVSTGTFAIQPSASTTWVLGTCEAFTAAEKTAPTGDCIFRFKPGKVATETTGSANWQVAAKATASTTTGFSYDTTPGAFMNWYGEISLPSPSSVDWGEVDPGTDFGDPTRQPIPPAAISITYIANGDYDQKVKTTTATWTGTPSGTATLDATGNCANPDQFALKADDTNNLTTAVLVNTSGVSIDNTGTQTSESGNTKASNYLWLKLAEVFTKATYNGTITYTIENR